MLVVAGAMFGTGTVGDEGFIGESVTLIVEEDVVASCSDMEVDWEGRGLGRAG